MILPRNGRARTAARADLADVGCDASSAAATKARSYKYMALAAPMARRMHYEDESRHRASAEAGDEERPIPVAGRSSRGSGVRRSRPRPDDDDRSDWSRPAELRIRVHVHHARGWCHGSAHVHPAMRFGGGIVVAMEQYVTSTSAASRDRPWRWAAPGRRTALRWRARPPRRSSRTRPTSSISAEA